MNKYILLLATFSAYCAEKELPKTTLRIREVIIYPPTTPEEFIERRRILTDALTSSTLARIIIKDKRSKGTND